MPKYRVLAIVVFATASMVLDGSLVLGDLALRAGG